MAAPIKVIFVAHDCLSVIGGTATLISNMSKWLIRHGHQVWLLGNTDQVTDHLLPESMEIIEVENICDLFSPRGFRLFVERNNLPSVDLVKSFDIRSCWIACQLSDHMDNRPKILFGSYNPRLKLTNWNPFSSLRQRIFELNLKYGVSGSSRLMMNQLHLHEFRRVFGKRQEGVVWSLPCTKSGQALVARTPVPGLIVSVGRLDSMKEYNLVIPKLVASLKEEGCPVRWRVYGDGKYRKEIIDAIGELGLDGEVRVFGSIGPHQFDDVLKDAWVFVGMGLSLVEASSRGVPNLAAIPYDNIGFTQGSLADFSEGCVGEYDPRFPMKNLSAELTRICCMTESDYREESEKQMAAAVSFDEDAQMRKFLQHARRAKPSKKIWWLKIIYRIYDLFKPGPKS